jgi:hypothetical protein
MLGAGVGAAILNVARSVIPQGLLTGGLTLAFDMRVVAFCVLRCRDVYRWAAVRPRPGMAGHRSLVCQRT